MKVNTHNDWDPLEEIIVGHADHARVTLDKTQHSFSYADKTYDEIAHMEGPLPQSIIDEANEDIQGLVDVLQSADVIVHRPKSICLLYTSPSPRDRTRSRMPSSA